MRLADAFVRFKVSDYNSTKQFVKNKAIHPSTNHNSRNCDGYNWASHASSPPTHSWFKQVTLSLHERILLT